MELRGRLIAPVIALVLAAGLAGCATVQADGDFDRAVTAFKAGSYVEAERLGMAADRATPEVDKIQALVGWARLMQGNVKGAEMALARLKERSPDYIEAIQLDAWIALAYYDYAKAAERFQAQYDWCKRLRKSAYYPGRFSVKDYAFVEATFADANHGLGLVALGRKDLPGAIAYLRAAASIEQYGARATVQATLAALEPVR